MLEDGTPAGFLAHVFSCGDCSKESSRIIGYLTADIYVPISTQPDGTSADKPGVEADETRHLFVSRPGNPPEWVPKNSSMADKIRSEVKLKCRDNPDLKDPSPRLKECFP